jgi:hypothetical protein
MEPCMAEAARVALPRLRAAWLREMGVEILWPTTSRPLSSSVSPSGLQEEGMPEVDALPGAPPADTTAAAVTRPPLSTTTTGPIPGEDVPLSPDKGAARASGPLEATGQNAGTARLQCRVYAGDVSFAGARWMVVADAAELHASREGPVRFVDALMQAVMPKAKASITFIPVPEEDAVGWLAGDEDFARLAAGGARLILIGMAVRRAAGMPTRLGEIGRLPVGAAQATAVALPLPSDLTASPTGKAEAWRVLRALASVGD